jgi:hypothetical protein
VYFAGFATAIYFLAPPPDGEVAKSTNKDSPQARFDSQEFVQSFNTGMRKCLDFGKEAAQRTAKLVKEKVEEINDT